MAQNDNQPMKRVILYDVSRILARRHFDTPTGIDRVDLRYLNYFLNDPNSEVFGIYLKKERVRLSGGIGLRKIVSTLMKRWNEAGFAEKNSTFKMDMLVNLAKMKDGFDPLRRHFHKEILPRKFTKMDNIFYVNCSHHGMRNHNKRMFKVMRDLINCKMIFYVHDMIPLDFPHLVGKGHPERHVERMTIVAENADMVICNSIYSAERFTDFAQSQGLPTPEPVVLSIGVENTFSSTVTKDAVASSDGKPYFVIIGTVEPRKNHILLLEAWEMLIARGGSVPQLRIIGRRGWTTEANLDYDERVASLAPHIVETGAVSDEDLRENLLGARAQLFPSFVEGWGMPAVESMVAGIPVIISDTAGLIEATQGLAATASPHDPAAWANMVERLVNPSDSFLNDLREKMQKYRPPTWKNQFIDFEEAFQKTFF